MQVNAGERRELFNKILEVFDSPYKSNEWFEEKYWKKRAIPVRLTCSSWLTQSSNLSIHYILYLKKCLCKNIEKIRILMKKPKNYYCHRKEHDSNSNRDFAYNNL